MRIELHLTDRDRCISDTTFRIVQVRGLDGLWGTTLIGVDLFDKTTQEQYDASVLRAGAENVRIVSRRTVVLDTVEA